MILHCFKNAAELDKVAADFMLALVRAKPNAVLGLATGSTPVGAYQHMVQAYQQGTVSFSQVKTVNLDEYVGLAVDHPESYRQFMQTQLFNHIDIKPENTHVPNGMATDIAAECRRYDDVLSQQGTVDMQFLGLGLNGHIGFNEPNDSLSRFTHQVTLQPETRLANQRFFNSLDEVPTHALSMGMGSILHAKTILLVVKGASKAAILDRALNGPITTQVPASLLQMHPRVIVLTDCDVSYKCCNG